MNFTREPIVETIITPKEGFKLVLRNSKGAAQEEFFVDAVEVITFGHACFYRSLEKPKCFVVPVGDYEILEVRETRVVLKTPAVEKGGIKIGGGREATVKAPREPKEPEEAAVEKALSEVDAAAAAEHKGDKRREKRRLRKRRGRDQDSSVEEEGAEAVDAPFSEEAREEPRKEFEPSKREERAAALIPPPSTLISETLSRYKDTPGFSSAFFEKKEEVVEKKVDEESEKEDTQLLLDDEVEPDFFAEERITGERVEEEDDETL